MAPEYSIFLAYRNPTFIGSAPQCEIYLFKDKCVGRRHAAMHIMEGGYDIEDFGTGGMTRQRQSHRARAIAQWR
jgi:hypothetical protein